MRQLRREPARPASISAAPASPARSLATASQPLPVVRERVVHGVTVLSVLSIVAGVLNYGSNLAFGHVLGVASYGDLTTLMALFVVISVPFAAAQTRIAQRAAKHVDRGEAAQLTQLVRGTASQMVALGVVATAIYCACVPLIADVLSLHSVWSAYALAPMIFFAFCLPVLQGTLQGLERWIAFGLVGVALGAGRLAFGLPLAIVFGNAIGAIVGQGLGMLVALVGTGWLLREYFRRGDARADWRAVGMPNVRAVGPGIAFVLFAVIANCDIVFAKLWMTPEQAGRYAALATIGKVITYLPAAVAVVVVPSAAKAADGLHAPTRVLRRSAWLVGGLSLIAMVPAIADPRLLVAILFGHRYMSIVAGVLPIVLAGGGLALLYLLITYSVVVGDFRCARFLALGVPIQAVGISLFHGSPAQVAAVQAGTVGVMLLLNELGPHALLMRRRDV
jgi:O-antigen/teichoic acid export membrane protein